MKLQSIIEAVLNSSIDNSRNLVGLRKSVNMTRVNQSNGALMCQALASSILFLLLLFILYYSFDYFLYLKLIYY